MVWSKRNRLNEGCFGSLFSMRTVHKPDNCAIMGEILVVPDRRYASAGIVEGGFIYCGNIIGGDAKGRYSGNC